MLHCMINTLLAVTKISDETPEESKGSSIVCHVLSTALHVPWLALNINTRLRKNG